MNDRKFAGLLLIVLGLMAIAMFFIFNQGTKKVEKENDTLKKELTDVKKEEQEKEGTIKRMDVNSTNKEEQKIREVSEEFITLLYTSNINTNDKERYESIKKVSTDNIADSYFGEKRKSPILYDTTVNDINIYSNEFTPLNNETKTFATLYQNVKDADGKEVSNRKVAMELTLTYENQVWKVSKFEQFDESQIKNEEASQ